MQAFYGLTLASAGGLGILVTDRLAAPIAWSSLVFGIDQCITGLRTAITGKPRMSATEHVLQKVGMPAEWASFTSGLTGTGLIMKSTAIIRSSRLAAFPRYSLPVNNALETETESIVGHYAWEIKCPPYQNTPRHTTTSIQNRIYSGHTLDQMQNCGFVPSVVENTIRKGCIFSTKSGTIGYYDSINSVRVIVNYTNVKVVTVIPGAPK